MNKQDKQIKRFLKYLRDERSNRSSYKLASVLDNPTQEQISRLHELVKDTIEHYEKKTRHTEFSFELMQNEGIVDVLFTVIAGTAGIARHHRENVVTVLFSRIKSEFKDTIFEVNYKQTFYLSFANERRENPDGVENNYEEEALIKIKTILNEVLEHVGESVPNTLEKEIGVKRLTELKDRIQVIAKAEVKFYDDVAVNERENKAKIAAVQLYVDLRLPEEVRDRLKGFFAVELKKEMANARFSLLEKQHILRDIMALRLADAIAGGAVPYREIHQSASKKLCEKSDESVY